MKRYIINLLGLLFPFVAIAQTDGYNPVNPPNPSWPVADTTTYYKVNLVDEYHVPIIFFFTLKDNTVPNTRQERGCNDTCKTCYCNYNIIII